ncbi:adhesin protein Mad2 [Pochonia chlamydosporia 170]|uniref:Adhesin protein Mad2 n=1 Tax=Pochonia chlamydosporia 170 TaxID=1380566 RepID=A0A179FSM2_METCM|nr:adhesin protein Mad2 [Pochonia chlamydosporia 170]OAQ68612.1 adhesin protein Mad2 [Pochonia chlamydosporia 170]
MKSAVIAAAAVAAVASAHEARSPLQLGLDVGGLVSVDICLGLNIKLPAKISIESDDCPKSLPPPGCTDVWHPPHHVPMDGCDDNGNHEWHYVHPCDCKPEAPHTWGTSTVTQTQIQTIISCAPTVTNCPGRGQVTTVIIPATTTICPVPVTTSTLATVPATWTKPATVPGTVPATTQAPPTYTKPGTQAPPPPATTPCTTTPVVVAPPPPATTPCTTTPVVVVPPPMGTGTQVQPPSGNWTQPPVIAGAAQNSQKVGAVVAMGLVAALLI